MKSKENRREIYIYIALIIIQILVMVYWCNVKVNYHIDELYSMGYASSFNGRGDSARYITTAPEFGFNKWIDNSVLKKHLIVSEEERVFNTPILSVVKNFFGGRNYVCLLNIAESFSDSGKITPIPGFILNIILMILSDILLIMFMKKLGIQEQVRYPAFIMYAFSGYTISTVEFIRFYMLIVVLALLMIILIHRLWETNRWTTVICTELLLAFLGYLATKDSELTLPFLGTVMACFAVAFLVSKKMKQFYSCVGGGILIGIYFAVKSNFLDILLHPVADSVDKNAWMRASLSIHELSVDHARYLLNTLRELFETHYFGSRTMMYLLAAAVTMCLILARTGSDDHTELNVKRIRPITVIAFIIWMPVLGLSMLTGHGRFICIMMLYIIAVMGTCQMLGVRISINLKTLTGRLSSDEKFIIVLLIGTVFNTAVLLLFGFDTWRYYVYVFVAGPVILWFIADKLLKNPEVIHVQKALIATITVFTIINALIPFRSRAIEYMYEEEKHFADNVRACQDLDVIMYLPVDEETILIEELGYLSRHAIYDCVYYMPDSTRICIYNINEYKSGQTDYPDHFVLWTKEDQDDMDIDRVIKDFHNMGYSVTDLGCGHNSRAYLVGDDGG